ncbi:MAG: segregation/condensation protein A [Chloroflexota bacterium]
MTTASPYKIDLPAFAGPLDLLLHLINREELDITALSLLQITSQYLEQVEMMKGNRVEQLIDFIVIGARLAQIKSRALLPRIPTQADEEEEEDPAEALIQQLKRYKQFKEAGNWLKKRHENGYRTYLRVAPPPKIETKLDLSNITLEKLRTAVLNVLARAEELEDSVSIVQPRRLTIEDQLKRLRFQLTRKREFLFNDVLSRHPNRTEVAVTLLAILELIKRKELVVTQTELFGPIEIRRGTRATTTPAAAPSETQDKQ